MKFAKFLQSKASFQRAAECAFPIRVSRILSILDSLLLSQSVIQLFAVLYVMLVNLHIGQSFVRSEVNAKSFARTIFLPLHMHSVFSNQFENYLSDI